jgi:hypothetical protein
VPEVGGQHREPRVPVCAGVVGVGHGAHRHRVSEIVSPWPAGRGACPQAGVSCELEEREVHAVVDQPGAGGGDEHGWGARFRAWVEPATPPQIVVERVDRGRVQRHQSGLAELRVAHDQQPAFPIDVAGVEADRFPDPQAADRQQAEQRSVGADQQRVAQHRGGVDQCGDLTVAVDVWGRAPVAGTQQPARWHLGRGVDRLQVGRELAGHRQPVRERRRVGVLGQGRPVKRQLGGDPLRATRFQERDEVPQRPLVLGQLVAERTPDPQIVRQRGPQTIGRCVELSTSRPSGPGLAGRQRSPRRYLVCGVKLAQVSGEPTDHRQPVRAMPIAAARRERCPLDRELDRDSLSTTLLQELNEVLERGADLPELDARGASDA